MSTVLTEIDFCHGITLGLCDLRVKQIDFLSDAGHAAALEVFTYIERSCRDQFDLEFVIILHEVWCTSGDWRSIVFTLTVAGLLSRSTDGMFHVQAHQEDLDMWFERQRGSREFWKSCAEMYLAAFNDYNRLHPRFV